MYIHIVDPFDCCSQRFGGPPVHFVHRKRQPARKNANGGSGEIGAKLSHPSRGYACVAPTPAPCAGVEVEGLRCMLGCRVQRQHPFKASHQFQFEQRWVFTIHGHRLVEQVFLRVSAGRMTRRSPGL